MSLREFSQWGCSTSSRCEQEAQNCWSVSARRECFLRPSRALPQRHTRAGGVGRVALSPQRVCPYAALGGNGAVSPTSGSAESSHSMCSVYEGTAVTICTDFVAETLLPTSSGQYRLRAYRHTLHLVRMAFDSQLHYFCTYVLLDVHLQLKGIWQAVLHSHNADCNQNLPYISSHGRL